MSFPESLRDTVGESPSFGERGGVLYGDQQNLSVIRVEVFSAKEGREEKQRVEVTLGGVAADDRFPRTALRRVVYSSDKNGESKMSSFDDVDN